MAATRKIHGTTYRVDRILATKALSLKVRIGKVLGPGLASFDLSVIGAAVADESEKSGADAAIMKAIGMAFERCNADDVVSLASEIVSYAEVQTESKDWAQADIDSDLSERPADLYPLIAFVLQEALGAFFPAGAGKRLAAAVKAH